MSHVVRASLSNINTLRPRIVSVFGEQAEDIATHFAVQYGMYSHNFTAFNTMSRFAYPHSVSTARLAAAGIVHNIFFYIDDLFFDHVLSPEEHGIDTATYLNPGPYLRSLMHTFATQEMPEHPTLMHFAFADIGQQLILLTSEEWLSKFTAAIFAYMIAAEQRRRIDFTGALADFIEVRDLDTGGLQTCMLLEVTNDCVLPDVARQNETLSKMTWLTYRSAAWVNDIISYHKDVIIEGSEFNLVQMFLKEGRTFDEAVTESVELVNEMIQQFLDLEAELPSWDVETDAIVSRYVSGLKDLMSGNTYWHLTSPRYRHPESPFAELRDV